jgi:hypothetical protein
VKPEDLLEFAALGPLAPFLAPRWGLRRAFQGGPFYGQYQDNQGTNRLLMNLSHPAGAAQLAMPTYSDTRGLPTFGSRFDNPFGWPAAPLPQLQGTMDPGALYAPLSDWKQFYWLRDRKPMKGG